MMETVIIMMNIVVCLNVSINIIELITITIIVIKTRGLIEVKIIVIIEKNDLNNKSVRWIRKEIFFLLSNITRIKTETSKNVTFNTFYDHYTDMDRRKILISSFFMSPHKKWRFSLQISSVNVTKFLVSCGFGHIYRRNL